MSEITDAQWDSLIKSIIDKKCILFLGPGITVNYNNANSLGLFYEEISRKSLNSVAVHKSDNLLVFREYDTEVETRTKVKDFFSKDFSNDLLEKIADIPFHLIISVSPDHTVANIFERKKYRKQKNFLSKTRKGVVEFPINDVPLIYNLFGDIEDEMSIIFSHCDLFEYLEKGWVGSNCLPEAITTSFNKENTSNIIFLGFEFDKWYYQFILYLLKINYSGCRRYAALQESFGDEMMTLCESNYHINFVNKELKFFVEKLYNDFPEKYRRKPSLEAESPRRWKKGQFEKFLSDALSSSEWSSFCLTHFWEVYKDFTSDQPKTVQINMLIDYVTRKDRFDELYNLCKEHNQVSFENHGPYYEK